jgi:hypothetical protein
MNSQDDARYAEYQRNRDEEVIKPKRRLCKESSGESQEDNRSRYYPKGDSQCVIALANVSDGSFTGGLGDILGN